MSVVALYKARQSSGVLWKTSDLFIHYVKYEILNICNFNVNSTPPFRSTKNYILAAFGVPIQKAQQGENDEA